MKRVLAFLVAILIMALALTGCKEQSSTLTDGDLIRLDQSTEGIRADGENGVDGLKSDYPEDTSISGSGDALTNAGNSSLSDSSGSTAADLDFPASSSSNPVIDNSNGDGVDTEGSEVAGSIYSENDDEGPAGGINPSVGGVLDNKEFIDEFDYENASSDSYGYQSDQNSGNKSVTKVKGESFSEPRRPVTVYYQDTDGSVIPMTRWIQPQLGVAKAAISLTIDNPLIREETVYYGVYPTLPEHTEVLGIDIMEGIATIDFNRYLLSYGTAYSERNIIAAIVYTLTEFETIQKVRILINGYEQGLLKYGTDLTYPLGREDIMINTNPGPNQLIAGKRKLDVYFMKQANTGFTYPLPVSMIDSGGGTDSMPEALINKLLSNDTEAGMYSEMPEGVSLISSYVDDGVITLNFSKEFLNYGGTAREEAILKQLAYTLRRCDNVKKISILVEGRKVELPEGTNIAAGLAIPVTINDVMDR